MKNRTSHRVSDQVIRENPAEPGHRNIVSKLLTSHRVILRRVPKPCLQTALHQALQLLLAHLVEQQLERELDERDLLRGEGLLQAARQRLPDLPA